MRRLAIFLMALPLLAACTHSPSTTVTNEAIPIQAPEPNRTLTPGALNPAVTESTKTTTICKSGWTSTVRPPVGYTEPLKRKQINQYGYADKKLGDYEEDHDVPLELGGAPSDPANLWPEPHAPTVGGSPTKDALENLLHARICKYHDLSLAAAQQAFLGDWYAAWKQYGQPMPRNNYPFYSGGTK